jgi:penicillin amidase
MSGTGPESRRRRLPLAEAALALVIVAALGGLWARDLSRSALARSAFPVASGTLRVDGIRAAIRIDRDAHGFPHVEGQNEADAFFGLGFVHAQDRLAQMLWLARAARGRTAEVVGPSGVAADRLARLLDLGRIADERFDGLDAATRGVLEAYAAGVNARIERIRSGRVAPPLAIVRLGLPLEKWQPADSIAVAKLYAWGAAGSLDVSLVLSDLIERLGGFESRLFFPRRGGVGLPEPGRPPVMAQAVPRASRHGSRATGVESPGQHPVARWTRDPLRRAVGLEGRSIGSSAWVLGGAHSASGRPLLVADAHLEPTAPPLLHIAHIRGGDWDLAGAMLPGVPVVWTGHNRRVAWASTQAGAATTDLYVETLNPRDRTLYHDGKGWRSLEQRVETIRVKGGQDEVLTIQSTVRGPLLQSIRIERGEPLSLTWIGTRVRDASSIHSLLAVGRAVDAESLRAALASHDEPALAVVYADRAGSAGVQVAGWIPQRALPAGLVPLPGRALWYDWQGRIPFEDLPGERLEGGKGWVVAADNPLPHSKGDPPIEWLWRNGARAQRIDQLLRAAVAGGSVDLRRMTDLQRDVEANRARALISGALQLAGDVAELGSEARELAALLRAWDGRATATSVGAAAYHVFLETLTEELFADPLGGELLQRYRALPQADVDQVVYGIVRGAGEGIDGDGWTGRDRVHAAIHKSLREAWLRLSFRLGANRRKWHWGRLHPLRFRAYGPRDLGDRELEGLDSIAYGGTTGTVNAAEYDASVPFEVRVASTLRFAIDTAKLDEVLVAIAPGQSEHPRHPHFQSGLQGWLEGTASPLVSSRVLVDDGRVARLVLEPGS